MESRISAGHNIARRVIYDYELVYIEKGTFNLIYDDISYRCTAGDIIFIRPGIPHSFIIDLGERFSKNEASSVSFSKLQ
jgi:quercetin dioxygenase-like cupin family protein